MRIHEGVGGRPPCQTLTIVLVSYTIVGISFIPEKATLSGSRPKSPAQRALAMKRRPRPVDLGMFLEPRPGTHDGRRIPNLRGAQRRRGSPADSGVTASQHVAFRS